MTKRKRIIITVSAVTSALLCVTLALFYFIYRTPRGYRMTVPIHGYSEMIDGVWLDDDFTGDTDYVLDCVFDARDRVRAYYGEITAEPWLIITENEEKLKRLGGVYDILTFAVGEVYSYISISSESLTVDLAAHELMHAETHERLYSGTVTFERGVPVWFDEGVALQADNSTNYTWGKFLRHTENMTILPDFDKLSDADYFYGSDAETVQYNYIVSKFELGRWIDENGGFEAVTELIEELRSGKDFYELYDVPLLGK